MGWYIEAFHVRQDCHLGDFHQPRLSAIFKNKLVQYL